MNFYMAIFTMVSKRSVWQASRLVLIAAVTAAAAWLSACGGGSDELPWVEVPVNLNGPWPMRNHLLHSNAEWNSLWASVWESRAEPPLAPAVDFSQSTLIGISPPEDSIFSSCGSIEILHVRSRGDVLEVEYRFRGVRPQVAICTALATATVQFVLVPGYVSGEIKLIHGADLDLAPGMTALKGV